MYMILTPLLQIPGMSYWSHTDASSYNITITSEVLVVSKSLKVPGTKVYKLDSLQEIKDIEITFNKVPKDNS